MFNTRSAFIVAVAICLSTLTAQAQINPGHFTGTVKDAQGAVLPGVTVTATSPALLGSQAVTYGGRRRIPFPDLPAGTYDAHVRALGIPDDEAGEHRAGHRPDVERRFDAAAGVVVGDDYGQRASPVVDKQATAVGYVQTTGAADRRADLDRPLGRAGADAGCPHAGR